MRAYSAFILISPFIRFTNDTSIRMSLFSACPETLHPKPSTFQLVPETLKDMNHVKAMGSSDALTFARVSRIGASGFHSGT